MKSLDDIFGELRSTAYKMAFALQIAAEEAYNSEVVDTEMEEHIIGPDGEYETAEEWMNDRVLWWLEQAMERVPKS